MGKSFVIDFVIINEVPHNIVVIIKAANASPFFFGGTVSSIRVLFYIAIKKEKLT